TQIETQVFNVVALKSTIANKNLLSSLLYLCLPFAVIQLQKSKRIIKVLQIVLIVFTLIVLWVLQSKATLIAVLVLITGAMGYFLKSVRGRKRKYGVLAGSILLIGLFGFVSTNYQQQFRYLTNANSVHLRLKLWDNSWQMYKENPLGVGAGNWKLSFPKYGLDKFEHERFVQGRTHFQRPHNDFLSVLCETGPIGLCLFQGFFLIVVYQGFKLLSVNNEYQFRHWCLFLGIVGYMIIMFIDFPFERIEHQMILFSIFALITVRFEKEFLSKQFASPKLVLLMGILLSIFSVIISMYRIVGEQNTHDIIQYHTKGKWGKLTKSVQNTMGKFYEMDPMATPLPWYEGVAHFSSGNFKKALESFEHAYEIHPNHIHVLNNLGSTLEKNGKRKEAIEHYRKALQISPFFEESRLNLSALYFNNQEYDLAFQIIDSCSVTSQNAKYPPFLNAILAKFAEAHNDQIPSEVLAQGNLIEHYKRRKADGKSFLGLD
ncbi:MAG: O-antigen ligase family protein, partial [Flavobacteriales bacterium]|nr:O-antigen ligase family protein [Flavobacteriales bacterium]